MERDIRGIAFEEFLEFLFNQPGSSDPLHHWYYDEEIVFHPAEVVDHYVRLFNDAAPLASRYTPQQLEEGFWAIQSENLDCSAQHIIWDEALPFSIRAKCVQSMAELFKSLFAQQSLETASDMWWDSFCYAWHCGNRSRENGGEDQAMQDVIFGTLAQILELDSTHCQGAALHGLGHLHHPETEALIRRYLDRNSATLSANMKEYALAAAAFRVM